LNKLETSKGVIELYLKAFRRKVLAAGDASGGTREV